jgi:hypothetical protein
VTLRDGSRRRGGSPAAQITSRTRPARPARRSFRSAVTPGYEDAEDSSRKKKLEAGREGPRAMPATVVKELLPTWAERRYDMLEIGRRRCEPAERRGVKEAAPHNKHAKCSNTGSNLKPAASDVLVWKAI